MKRPAMVASVSATFFFRPAVLLVTKTTQEKGKYRLKENKPDAFKLFFDKLVCVH